MCRRWWKRGFSCPFAPHPDEDERPGGPEAGEPPTDEPQVRPPPALFMAERKRLRTMIDEVMQQFEGDTDAEVMAEAVKRLGERAPVAGMAEEAIADTVRDRVFKLPVLPELPAIPLGARPAAARGFAVGGFMFNATERLFGIMRTFPTGGGTGGGEPGGGTGMGGGATG